MYYDDAKAQKVIDFIQSLHHTKGRWAGQPFHLLPWERDLIIKPLFGTMNDDGFRYYRTCYIEIPKKNGKALDIKTPIPTPLGFKKMGEIVAGDIVFSDTGTQCRVIHATDIIYDRDCFEVTLADGEKIITDADHEWVVTELIDTYKKGVRIQYDENIVTTREMFKNLTSHGGRCKTYKIKICRPLVAPVINLPIPPYTLGAWLGDGSSALVRLACTDTEIIREIIAEGVSVNLVENIPEKTKMYLLGRGEGSQAKNFSGTGNSLQTQLRKLKLLKDKQIPDMYLRASIGQRQALLRGLMDTDGYCSAAGQCEFTTTKEKLFTGFIELVRSLGYKPTSSIGRAMLRGKDCGVKYRVQFFAFQGDDVFSIARKKKRLKKRPIKSTRSQYRTVIAITPVPSVPVKCISVDSPSQQYLAGKGFIPTHNTELGAAIGLYMLCADGENSPEVYSAAADTDNAALIYTAAEYMRRTEETLNQTLIVLDSQKKIKNPRNNGFYKVLSAEHYSKHGINPSCILFDEIHAQPDDRLWTVLTSGTDYARQQQLVFVMTTAGIYDVNSLWWRLRTKARQIADGTIPGGSFLPVLFIADQEKDDPADEELWKRVNPSIGHIFSLDKIREDYNESKKDPVEFQNFLRFRLNIPVKQISRWMPMADWDGCGGEIDMAALAGRKCYGGLDLASTTDLAAFVLVFPPVADDDIYIVLPKFYVPQEGIIKRSQTDRVHYDIWAQKGFITATPGNTIDHGFIRRDIVAASKLYNLQELGYDPWGATELANTLQNDNGIIMVEMRQGARTLSEPAKRLLTQVMNRKINHGSNPVLRWCADNLVMVPDANENFRPDKAKATDRIDGMVALIMAYGRAMFTEKKISVYEERGMLSA